MIFWELNFKHGRGSRHVHFFSDDMVVLTGGLVERSLEIAALAGIGFGVAACHLVDPVGPFAPRTTLMMFHVMAGSFFEPLTGGKVG
jgi:hypothetical protein